MNIIFTTVQYAFYLLSLVESIIIIYAAYKVYYSHYEIIKKENNCHNEEQYSEKQKQEENDDKNESINKLKNLILDSIGSHIALNMGELINKSLLNESLLSDIGTKINKLDDNFNKSTFDCITVNNIKCDNLNSTNALIDTLKSNTMKNDNNILQTRSQSKYKIKVYANSEDFESDHSSPNDSKESDYESPKSKNDKNSKNSESQQNKYDKQEEEKGRARSFFRRKKNIGSINTTNNTNHKGSKKNNKFNNLLDLLK